MTDGESPKRSVRLGRDLDRLVDKYLTKTRRKTLSQYLRVLIARDLGVDVPHMPEGRRKQSDDS